MCAPYPSPAPSTYFRIEQFRAPLRARGLDLEVHPFVLPEEYGVLYTAGRATRAGILARGWSRRLRLLRRLRPGDVVMVQRELAPACAGPLLTQLRASGAAWTYDFDDAVYLASPGGERMLRRLKHPAAATTALCGAADAVWPGNDALADFAIRVRGADTEVQVLPTVVDTDLYTPRPQAPAEDGLPVIGWVGSHTTLPYLEGLFPMLSRLAQRVGFRLRVVCNQRPAAPPPDPLRLEFEHWTPERRVEALGCFDCGIYPVPDDEWARGKCGLKALEYGACGIPTVCPPVGVLPQVVRDGVTGHLVRTDDEWVDALTSLLTDRAARGRMGAAARRHVGQHYAVRVWVDDLAGRLRSLAPGVA